MLYLVRILFIRFVDLLNNSLHNFPTTSGIEPTCALHTLKGRQEQLSKDLFTARRHILERIQATIASTVREVDLEIIVLLRKHYELVPLPEGMGITDGYTATICKAYDMKNNPSARD